MKLRHSGGVIILSSTLSSCFPPPRFITPRFLASSSLNSCASLKLTVSNTRELKYLKVRDKGREPKYLKIMEDKGREKGREIRLRLLHKA